MKPRILVLYYTQTGQLRDILDSLVTDIQQDADITFARIEPEQPFPFPWNARNFFDAMPESVVRIPSPVKPLPEEVLNARYDLVIFGYQPWFLHPSQPVTSFMKSQFAAVLRGKPVVTVVGSRNMWLNAQEKIKEDLREWSARLVGNIVLTDTNPNLVSLLTVIRWSFKGQKEPSRFLPAAGVQDADIKGARRFGPVILKALKENRLDALHGELLAKGAVQLQTGLVLMEKQGIKNFRFWAKYIREKGGPGDPARAGRVRMYKNLLLTGIFVLTPITGTLAAIKKKVQSRQLKKDVDYFRQIGYEPGRI